jgi:hypothetical protein
MNCKGNGAGTEGILTSNRQSHKKQFLIILIIIKLLLLKIRVRNEKFQIYEWQRVIGSDAFVCYKYHTPFAQFSQTQI